MLPLDRNRSYGLSAKGTTYLKGELQATFVYIVTPGYLGAMRVQLLEGRDFSWQDTSCSERVVIINQAAAHRLWQGEDPFGQIALVNSTENRVIGVVSDVLIPTPCFV
jgi:hypothetical protein